MGFPHAHVILILERHSKHALQNSLIMDKSISAEIPPDLETTLKRSLFNNIIHGPCGDLHPSAPCITDENCTKRFSKSFKQETVVF